MRSQRYNGSGVPIQKRDWLSTVKLSSKLKLKLLRCSCPAAGVMYEKSVKQYLFDF